VYKNKRVFRYNRRCDLQIGGTLFYKVGGGSKTAARSGKYRVVSIRKGRDCFVTTNILTKDKTSGVLLRKSC